MDPKEILKNVQDMFNSPEGKEVDVVYATSNGVIHLSAEDATSAAKILGDNVVMPYYKDDEVRKLGKKYNELEKAIFATDFLKLHKAKKLPIPLFQKYVEACKVYPIDPVTKELYEFIRSKVFATNRPVVAGQKDKIYMWKNGIVDATFMRRYTHGQIWQYNDNLVLTCPTNTELMSGSYFHIFSPILVK
mgnify:CR=1 FL=1